jgi:hypothetical protein
MCVCVCVCWRSHHKDAEMPILEDQVFQFKGPGGQTTVCPWVATAVIAGEVITPLPPNFPILRVWWAPPS